MDKVNPIEVLEMLESDVNYNHLVDLFDGDELEYLTELVRKDITEVI